MEDLTHLSIEDFNERIDILGQYVDPDPSGNQALSGRYAKVMFRFRDLLYVIETPKGAIRSGQSVTGRPWNNVMPYHYGYVAGTEGADGDEVDVCIGPCPDSDVVYIINQTGKDGQFDETKSYVGFSGPEQARTAYMSSYAVGWDGLGTIEAMDYHNWREWVLNGDHSYPAVSDYYVVPASHKLERIPQEPPMSDQFQLEAEILTKESEGDGPLYVYGAVLVPDKFDRQGDIVDEDVIRKSAREYMAKGQNAGLRHKWLLSKRGVHLTQSFVAPADMTIGEKDIPKGSWVVEFQVSDPTLKKSIEDGEYRAFSVGGRTIREPVED